MWSTKYLVLLVVVLTCLNANGQPSRKIFRNDYKYIESMQAFYKIYSLQKNWQDAKVKCESEGSTLFYPKDEDEANVIINIWNNTYHFTELYIGVSAPYSKSIFETVDGLHISSVYDNWAAGEPNDGYGSEDCVVMFRNGNLNDVSCDETNPFICKKTLSSIEWNEPCNLPDLSYEYSEKLGSCYKFHLKPMKWSDAYAQCHTEQSRLAIINSKDEANYLASLISKLEKDKIQGDYLRGAVHLGFRENDEIWQTIIRNTPLSQTGYTKWGAHQPDGRGVEKCGSMFYNGKLNDVDCDEKLLFICEHELNHSNEIDTRT